MVLNELVNFIVAKLERERKNVRGKVKVEARNLREFIDRLKGKAEEVRKEISVRPRNRAEGGRSGNGIDQIRLNNVRVRSEKGTGKQSMD